MDFKATVEIWRFFRQYSLANLVTGAQQIPAIENNDILLYPNPTKGKFTLHVSDVPARITIVNSLGQIVRQTEIDSKSDVDFYLNDKGIYFLQLMTPFENVVRKIVVGE